MHLNTEIEDEDGDGDGDGLEDGVGDGDKLVDEDIGDDLKPSNLNAIMAQSESNDQVRQFEF